LALIVISLLMAT